VIAFGDRLAGLLALVALGVAVATVVLLVRGRVPGWLRDEVALPVAATVATVATLGSLWMSEVAGYIPCELCWFQRIAMYPLTVVLWVATWRRDAAAWLTVLPIAGVGAAISVWHIAIERNPSMSGPCDPQAPCAVLWVQEFGFLTLPTMALIGFAAIAALSLAARPRPEADDPGERTLAADTHGGDRRGHES
jgi:disulfide bond formation protein DsbB